MCIIFFAYKVHSEYPFILAANRDEFYSRPSAAAHFWPDQPQVLAGRDLEQQGTWLGITRHGRFAALTNYRDPAAMRSDARSRGHLVSEFLAGHDSGEEYLAAVDRRAHEYNGFNLLAGTFNSKTELWYYSNRERVIRPLEAGIYGLSNHLLDTAWPKVKRGKLFFAEALSSGDQQMAELFWAILGDRSMAADEELPATGVSLEWERLLSSIHIASPAYGTRAMTIVLIGIDGTVQFMEQSLEPETGTWAKADYTFFILFRS